MGVIVDPSDPERPASQAYGVVDPNTGRTTAHAELLERYQAWLGDKRVLEVMLRELDADPQKLLAASEATAHEMLTEKEVAGLLVVFLRNRQVRRRIARVTGCSTSSLTRYKDDLVRRYYPDETEHLSDLLPG